MKLFSKIWTSFQNRKFRNKARKRALKANPNASELDIARAMLKDAQDLMSVVSGDAAEILDRTLSSYSEMADKILRHQGITPEDVERFLALMKSYKENLLKASSGEKLSPIKSAMDRALKRYDELIARLQQRIEAMRSLRQD
jgi:hypothetical protein